jgi:hypothetical protein
MAVLLYIYIYIYIYTELIHSLVPAFLAKVWAHIYTFEYMHGSAYTYMPAGARFEAT